MEIKSQRRGSYQAFSVPKDFNTATCISLKAAMIETLENRQMDVCLDVSSVESIDASGIRFIENVQKNLDKNDRKLAIVSPREAIIAQLEAAELECSVYPDLVVFEKTFREMSDKTRADYFRLCDSDGPIRRLLLSCPLCEAEGIRFYMMDPPAFELEWDQEIAPSWNFLGDPSNAMDFNQYEIGVCPGCLYAAARPDWFDVQLGSGNVLESTLTLEQIERLKIGHNARESLMPRHHRDNARAYFGMPREQAAAFHAWQIYERCLKDMSKARLNSDAFEIGRANLMMARYTEKESAFKSLIETAENHLRDIVEHPEYFSSLNYISACTLMIGIYFQQENPKEAKKTYGVLKEEMQKLKGIIGNRTEYNFWFNQASRIMLRE